MANAVDGGKEGPAAASRSHDVDKVKLMEKKLVERGVRRMERHPVDGLGGIRKPPPKSGHGGKYTWEGPDDVVESELEAPVAVDERDPNYAEEGEERRAAEEEEERVVGEVEVAKAVENREGVARVEVVPPRE